MHHLINVCLFIGGGSDHGGGKRTGPTNERLEVFQVKRDCNQVANAWSFLQADCNLPVTS